MVNKMEHIVSSGVILLILAFMISTGASQLDNQTQNGVMEISDDIEPYAGSIGPGSVFYGLKTALEDLDEGITFNATGKLEKKESHARLRLAEAKAELRKNNIRDADRALEKYREEIRTSEDLIQSLAGNDSGLLQAQRSIVKHQFVLEQLLASHPNVTGLERAFNNSVELEERFELKTRTKLERIEIKDRRRIRIRQIEREQVEVRARIVNNATDVRVEVKFLSGSTDRDAIAQEILERFRLSRENITALLEIEVEPEESLKRELDASAQVRNGISDVEAEFRFPLNTTDRAAIIEGIFRELSTLTKDEILRSLETKVKEQRAFEREELKIKAVVFDNASEARIELEFLTDSTLQAEIAQDIRNRFNLSREEISGLLELEAEREERIRLRERQDIEVKVEKGATDVKFELRFPLNAIRREDIVEGIRQKLSTLTISAQDIEFRERRDDRGGEGRDGRRGGDNGGGRGRG